MTRDGAAVSSARRSSRAPSATRTCSRVFDVGEWHGLPYVVSELLEGETLRAHLRPGLLTPREAASIRRADRARARGAPRPRHRPPRPQAGEPLRHERRPHQDPGPGPGRAEPGGRAHRRRALGDPDHGGRRGRRHGRLHVARAGASSSRRREVGHLRLRRRALRDARPPAPLPRGDGGGNDDGHPEARAAVPPGTRSVPAGSTRTGRRALPGQASRGPLSLRSRPRSRPRGHAGGGSAAGAPGEGVRSQRCWSGRGTPGSSAAGSAPACSPWRSWRRSGSGSGEGEPGATRPSPSWRREPPRSSGTTPPRVASPPSCRASRPRAWTSRAIGIGPSTRAIRRASSGRAASTAATPGGSRKSRCGRPCPAGRPTAGGSRSRGALPAAPGRSISFRRTAARSRSCLPKT